MAAVPLIFEQQMIGRLVSQWASRENRLGWGIRKIGIQTDALQLPPDSPNLAGLFRSLPFGLSFSLNY